MFSEPFRKVTVIDDLEQSKSVCKYLLGFDVLAIDVEGIDLSLSGTISLIQIAISCGEVYIFDVLALGNELFCASHLLPILSNPLILKLCYDGRCDCDILYHKHGVRVFGFFDIQILYTLLFQSGRDPFLKGLHRAMRTPGLLLSKSDIDIKAAKKFSWQSVCESSQEILERPLKPDLIEYCAIDVSCLFSMYYQWHCLVSVNIVSLMTNQRIQEFVCRDRSRKITMSHVDFDPSSYKGYRFNHRLYSNGEKTAAASTALPVYMFPGVISLKA